MLQKDTLEVMAEQWPLFFSQSGMCAVICLLTLINHSLQHYSPWRVAVGDSLSLIHTRTPPHTQTQLQAELKGGWLLH